MNELNISQELTKALEQFFTQNPIFCRGVDAERISILLWLGNNSKENPTYILKIANQKFIGLPRVDKNGQTYWKFKESWEELEKEKSADPSPSVPVDLTNPSKKKEETPVPSTPPNSESPITKFQERAAKTQALNNQGKLDHSQS